MPTPKEILGTIATLPRRQRTAAMKALGQEEYKRCGQDPLYWLTPERHIIPVPYVFTLDPHQFWTCNACGDKMPHSTKKRGVHLRLAHNIEGLVDHEFKSYYEPLDPIRPFPVLPYMPALISTWLAEDMFVIEKSRDVMATWLIVMLYGWDTIFHAGKQNIFQSKTSMDSNELVKRVQFIYMHQPKFLREVVKAEYVAGPTRSGVFSVPEINSEILGVAEGPNQVRQYHPSGIFQDEAAYQKQAMDAFTAIKPAIQNGGRFTAISSANPGWFQLVCQDKTV